ncbi:MAG: MFS transporter [Myxococcales bacterium]|nr:MFS transporter [Myxococcales bacterium]
MRARFWAALAAVTMGQGMLHTLVGVRMDAAGGTPAQVGLLTSAYFVGYVLGAGPLARVPRRLGHPRTFALGALGVAISAAGIGLLPWPSAWVVLRGVDGLAFGWLLLAVETWISEATPVERRGEVLGTYMTVFYAALAAGPLALLGLPAEGLAALCVVVAGGVVAAVGVRGLAPPPMRPVDAPAGTSVAGRAPLAVVAGVASGLLFGALYGLGPLYAQAAGVAPGLLMAAAILGGVALQHVAGRQSDRRGRPVVLAALGGALVPVCLLAALYPAPAVALIAVFAFGGLAGPIYPVAMAHLNDQVATHERLTAGRAMLLACAAGSVVGPLAAGALIDALGPRGLFVHALAVALAVGGAGAARMAGPTVRRRLARAPR